MELNQIKLNHNLITSLYSSHLIEDEIEVKDVILKAEKVVVSQKKSDAKFEFKFLGSNIKNILIVVNYQETAFLPDYHLTFLTKIISACKISLADVAIINFHSYKEKTSEEITTHYKSKEVLFFGVSPKEFGLPISFPNYQVQSFNKSTFLSSPTLGDLIDNVEEKMKLWESMKQIFSIK